MTTFCKICMAKRKNRVPLGGGGAGCAPCIRQCIHTFLLEIKYYKFQVTSSGFVILLATRTVGQNAGNISDGEFSLIAFLSQIDQTP